MRILLLGALLLTGCLDRAPTAGTDAPPSAADPLARDALVVDFAASVEVGAADTNGDVWQPEELGRESGVLIRPGTRQLVVFLNTTTTGSGYWVGSSVNGSDVTRLEPCEGSCVRTIAVPAGEFEEDTARWRFWWSIHAPTPVGVVVRGDLSIQILVDR